MKKLLIVALGSSFGGTEVYIRSLVGLLREDFEFSLLYSTPELAETVAPLGVDCTPVPVWRRAAKPLQLLQALFRMVRLIRAKRIEYVLVNGYSEILLVPFAKACGAQAFATRHLTFDMEVDHWWQDPGRFAARWLYRRMARYTDGIVAVSETVGDELRPLVADGQLWVIPNWIDAAALPEPPREHGRTRLLFVGRLTRLKGLDVLLRALQQLHDAGERRWCLQVLGTGDYEAELKTLSGALPVTFAGFQRDAASFYAAADVFINPSQGPEGLPLVTLEAMAHGLPSILSDLPVFLEVSRNGEDALIFTKDDPCDLAAKLRGMIASAELRATYSQAAVRAIAQRYHPAQARAAYLELFA